MSWAQWAPGKEAPSVARWVETVSDDIASLTHGSARTNAMLPMESQWRSATWHSQDSNLCSPGCKTQPAHHVGMTLPGEPPGDEISFTYDNNIQMIKDAPFFIQKCVVCNNVH